LYIEDCLKKSHSCCSTGDRTSELIIHLEDPISTETVRHELHKSNIHGRVEIAEPVITKSNPQMHK
jgi:hypothetical protein